MGQCCIKKVPEVEVDVDVKGNKTLCCFGENDTYECVCPSTCCVFTFSRREKQNISKREKEKK